MKAEDKARELVEKRYKYIMTWYEVIHDIAAVSEMVYRNRARELAKMDVDEILSAFEPYKGMYDQEIIDADKQYWQQVKSHINQ